MFKLLSLCLLLKYREQLEGRNSIKEYKKMMYINTNILLHKDHKIGKICTLGIFLCLILWEIFCQLCPNFLRRTRCVRWWNLGAAGGKSATKASARKTPSVHFYFSMQRTEFILACGNPEITQLWRFYEAFAKGYRNLFSYVMMCMY